MMLPLVESTLGRAKLQTAHRYAEIVGRERLIAGVDCGSGASVADSIVWARLRAQRGRRSRAGGCRVDSDLEAAREHHRPELWVSPKKALSRLWRGTLNGLTTVTPPQVKPS